MSVDNFGNTKCYNIEKESNHKSKRIVCLFYAAVFGIVSLLPWNALITADKYFTSGFTDGTLLKKIFVNTLLLGNTITIIIAFLLNTLYIYKFDRNLRVYIYFAFMVGGFFILIPFFFIDKTNIQTLYFVVIILVSITVTFFSSLTQALFIGVFGLFPSEFITIYMIGESFSGLFISLIKILITGININLKYSSILYFLVSIVSFIVATFCYFLANRNSYYLSLTLDNTTSNQTRRISLLKKLKVYKKIFIKTLYPSLTLFLTFSVTLTYFPAYTTKVVSSSENENWNRFFIPVYCFLFFNLGDVLGRSLTKLTKWPGTKSVLLPILALSRVLFFFPFALCKMERQIFGVYVRHDSFPVIVMLLFGITNGYLPTVSLKDANKHVAYSEAETCNILMSFIIGLGLTTGSLLSFALV